MNYKIRKLLYLLTRNSRQSLKELSSNLKVSQQGVLYQINSLEKQGLEYKALIDYSKIGNTNILVGFNMKIFDKVERNKIATYFKRQKEIVSFDIRSEIVDFIVEYSVPNLSRYNKLHTALMNEFHTKLNRVFALPIIVKHSYLRNYLVKTKDYEDIITLGDRDIFMLSENEQKILSELEASPREKLINMSKHSKIPIKQVTNIKKKLEKQNIIRAYRAENISVHKTNVLIRLSSESFQKMNAFTEFCKLHPNIIELYKVIGDYHAYITIEYIDKTETINELRKEFSFNKYFIF